MKGILAGGITGKTSLSILLSVVQREKRDSPLRISLRLDVTDLHIAASALLHRAAVEPQGRIVS
jgi:hypothetical protein